MIIVAIPARLESTRLPNKLMRNDTGYPLIWHTIQRTLTARSPSEIIVLTDHQSIADSINSYNMERVKVIMTGHAESGTDRIINFCKVLNVDDSHVIVNFQGDEPELSGEYIDRLVENLDFTSDVVTLASPATDVEAKSDSIVKVVTDSADKALYFSREAIPHKGPWLKHVGIYAYSVGFLKKISQMPPHPYGNEKLEQLRWLYNGAKIRVIVDKIDTVGIDTKAEYEEFVDRYLRSR
jgi:3-deoxy-manno-octulosonate cytidylyltransferase (CMP-KDO synthetase)